METYAEAPVAGLLPGRPRLAALSDTDALPTAAVFANRSGMPLMVRGEAAGSQIRQLRNASHNAPLVADAGLWSGRVATRRNPIGITNQDALFGMSLDQWGTAALAGSGASAVLTPSLFVPPQAWPVLQALVDALTAVTHPAVVAFVPTSTAMLDQSSFPTFRRILDRLHDRRVAWMFAGTREALAAYDRITALRTLMADHPASWVCAVDPLIATDALAHGADTAFVGVRSGLRWPASPGDSNGGGNAKDFIPGLFNRELLSLRSPSVYADWYVAAPSPVCQICGRAVDRYTSTDADKLAVLEHNLHATNAFGLELLAQPETTRAGWLHDERVRAFLAHHRLNPAGATLAADRALRRLCEIDDPMRRTTVPAGVWR